jgi:hypothetical protein
VTWPLAYRGQAVKVSPAAGGGPTSPGGGGTGTAAENPGQTSVGPSGGGLPLTGLTISILVTAAVVLLGAGVAVLLVARRRRSGVEGAIEDSRTR